MEGSNSKDACTVFVRNLPFDLSDSDFQREFEAIGPIKRGFIARKKDASRESLGYGFVWFATRSDADRAVLEMNGREVNGRSIRVEFAVKPGEKKPDIPSKPERERNQKQQKQSIPDRNPSSGQKDAEIQKPKSSKQKKEQLPVPVSVPEPTQSLVVDSTTSAQSVSTATPSAASSVVLAVTASKQSTWTSVPNKDSEPSTCVLVSGLHESQVQNAIAVARRYGRLEAVVAPAPESSDAG